MGSNRPDVKNCCAQPPNQQQQQSIAEEQQRPPQSSTTPAWGDRTAEDEPIEEKNNDSGLSPDNNSLSSGRTSSARVSFSSPGSSTSLDSSLMPGTSYDYSPQSVYNDCKLHEKSEPHEEDRTEDQSTGAQSNITESKSSVYVTHDIVRCPICFFNSSDRKLFIEHLSSHCLTKTNMELIEIVLRQLRSLQNEESRASAGQEDEKKEEENHNISIPRLNSQGKIKTFRCKQCDHVAITKAHFWTHSRIHIKLEKLMNCPKCPFVTEYKHHLEYHMRNHVGSKPFKCTECPYTCVNKSMLNSHMKSHSNVYQYRCANCAYATKYCHSLKLHLRKYRHQPAVVLCADGSPNSGSIYIDIYGTKRGPKKKSKISTDNSNHSPDVPKHDNNNSNNNVQPSPPQIDSVEPSPILAAIEEVKQEEEPPDLPLDLSKPSTSNLQQTTTNSPKVTGTRRRKGIAVKLERRVVEEDTDEEIPQDEKEICTPSTSNAQDHQEIKQNHDENNQTQVTKRKWFEKDHVCPYCDIAFGNELMYVVHMSYHGYKEPYTCNKCGEKCDNNISFFLHIGGSKHV